MKRLVLSAIFFVLLGFQGCNKFDCKDVICFTAPQPFVFEFLDKDSKQDLFFNGTLDSNQIEVFNPKDSSTISFQFLTQDSTSVIFINGIGWDTERSLVNATIEISGKYIVNLFVDSESVREDCCTFTRYYEIRVDSVDYENNSTFGGYSILLD